MKVSPKGLRLPLFDGSGMLGTAALANLALERKTRPLGHPRE
jgi:hypothetical protein